MSQNHLKELLLSGKYSDLVLKCKAREFRVHKNVVCPQSDFFSKAIEGPFKEAESGCIELSDDAPKDVQKMVTFLYTKDYANDESNVCGNEREKKQRIFPVLESQLSNIAMYTIGDKYDISDLKKCALDKFNRISGSDWFEHVVNIVQTAFDTTPESDIALRSAVMFSCAQEPDLYQNNEDFRVLINKSIPAAGVIYHKYVSQRESEMFNSANQELVRFQELLIKKDNYIQSITSSKDAMIQQLQTEISSLRTGIKGWESALKSQDEELAKMKTSMVKWKVKCRFCHWIGWCNLQTVAYDPEGYNCGDC